MSLRALIKGSTWNLYLQVGFDELLIVWNTILDTASLILPSALSLSANGDVVSNKRQRGDTMATLGR